MISDKSTVVSKSSDFPELHQQTVIKFRGLRLDNKQWAYGFVYRHDPPLQCFNGEDKELPAFAILTTGFADWNMQRPVEQHQVDGDTVGQYIGLHDKNDKEIYQGDVVKYCGGIGQVIFHNLSFQIWCSEYDTQDIDPTNIEVIGNIYENPELLK
jgi:hypothetical protein